MMSRAQYTLEWPFRPPDNPGLATMFAATDAVSEFKLKKLRHFADLLPFGGSMSSETHDGDGWFVVRVAEQAGSSVPSTGKMEDRDLMLAAERLAARTVTPSFADLRSSLPQDAFELGAFTYLDDPTEAEFDRLKRTPELLGSFLQLRPGSPVDLREAGSIELARKLADRDLVELDLWKADDGSERAAARLTPWGADIQERLG